MIAFLFDKSSFCNNLILIPYNISSYYTERWNLLDLSWDKFLGLENGESSGKAIINPSASIDSNSDNNFNNIIIFYLFTMTLIFKQKNSVLFYSAYPYLTWVF